MIELDSSPFKAIQFFTGKINLHKSFEFIVLKHINGETRYTVESITPEVTGQEQEIVEQSILNYVNIHGVPTTSNK